MEDLESRLTQIERRLDALESRPAAVPRQPVPPVYRTVPPPEPAQEPSSLDLENLLGSRWLPRAGALAILAAVAYLVALSLQRGWITPAMVVVGIALVCLGTIGLGMRLRDERESYGHVLVGLGIGGLYVDTVGAHFYQNLLSGETMVGACLAIGLATVGYGFWRALPTFLGIGLSGGLVAALMPLAKGNVATSAGLILLVAIPTFATAAGRRWPVAVAGTWVACFLASVSLLFSKGPVSVQLMPLDLILLIAVAAYTVSSAKFPTADPAGVFPIAASLTTAAAALPVLHGLQSTEHLLALGAAVTVVGAVFWRRESGRRIPLGGLGIAACLAPLALPGHQIDFALGFVALASAVAALRYRIVAPFAAFETVLALAAFLTNSATSAVLSQPNEAGLLFLLGAATTLSAVALRRPEGRTVAGLVVWGLTTRLALLELGLPSNASITLAWIGVCAVLFAVGFFFRLAELRQLGLTVAAITAAKVVMVDLAGLDSALKAVVLMVLGLVLLAGGYAYVRAGRKSTSTTDPGEAQLER